MIEERKVSAFEAESAPSPDPAVTRPHPGDDGGAPSYDEVDDRVAPPSSAVVTQKEEVTEQIFDQGESISE